MKNIIVAAACVCVCLAVPVPTDETNAEYVNVIGDNNEIYQANFDLPVNSDLSNDNERNSGNRYFLFTRRNPTSFQQLFMDNAASITSSNFNAADPTIVIAHGYLENRNANLNPLIRDACLGRGNFNVIVLDWSHVSMTSYILAISNIPSVGQGLGQFLLFLNRVTGAPLQSMHLVGFSLGSHVVGNGGRATGGRVGRVTGLDPFSPIWENNNNRLNPNDAIYVEVIHTNGYSSSVNLRMGNTDFYPNGGNSQPGCVTSICNHNRSWELYAATVSYDHLVGVECASIQEVASNSCRGRLFNMGNAIVNKFGVGLYRLTTQARYPY